MRYSNLKKVVLSTLLASSALMAGSSDFGVNTYSLVGIEGGYNSFDIEKNTGTTPAQQWKTNLNHVGLKIGAQSDNYRLFLSARYYDSADYDYAVTYGAEAQYLFNFTKYANFFLGVNGGIANLRFTPTTATSSVDIYDPYMGGDAGFNIHLGESVDFEFGGRVMSLKSEGTDSSGDTYKFDNIATGYASIIFRYKMD